MVPQAVDSQAGFARSIRRAARWAVADPHLLLAVGLASPTLIVHLSDPQAESAAVLALSVLFVAVMALLNLAPRQRAHVDWLGRPGLRLAFATLFVTVVANSTGEPGFRPLLALYIPVVTMAAAYGAREASLIGSLSGVGYLTAALATGEHVEDAIQHGLVLTAISIVLIIGTRRTMSSLEQTVHRLRQTMSDSRRRNRQVEAVEAVGRALAARGPEPDTLDQVMELLHHDLGHTHVSLYLLDGETLRLAAQRGYAQPILSFDGSSGVIGRVFRSHNAELVKDTARDPDFLAPAPEVTSEICAPLLVGDDLLGIVNVETAHGPLDETDLGSVLLVADRLASALALARERRWLAERADLFQRLASFGGSVTGSLDAKTLYPMIVEGIRRVLSSDFAVLTVLDRATGQYFVRAISGGDGSYIGSEIRPGEGVAGRAIRDRAVVVDDHLVRERYPIDVRGVVEAGVMAAIGLPLIRDGVVVGALTVCRFDLDKPFSRTEREVGEVVGSQVALAVTNTFLHSDVIEASVHDALTGLFNRRHLDASIDRFLAARLRLDPAMRVPAAVILFDLDHFGAFNKRHGHRIGDMVLRAFGDLLRERFRTSDLVARYGGEEFVAILEGATLDDAVRIANEVRRAWGTRTLNGNDGEQLRATVSAGCARVDESVITAEDLFIAADVGLAMAKAAGRDLVVAA
ncbi:MAG: diguanylate cyclase [Candidatus Limnocylindrales bacterium]